MQKYLLLTAFSLILLSGCVTSYKSTMPSASYNAAHVEYSLDIPKKKVATQAKLRSMLGAFLKNHEQVSNITISVMPSAKKGAVSSSAVRQMLQKLGISRSSITMNKPDALLGNTVVTLSGYTIIQPEPETWSYPPATADAPLPLLTGSSVNHNIGAMIANPKNAAERHPMAPADGEYSVKTINDYRSPNTQQPDPTTPQLPPNGGQ